MDYPKDLKLVSKEAESWSFYLSWKNFLP